MATRVDSHRDLDPTAAAVIARVAHEMRQPLAAAAAAVTMIRDTDRREHACEVLERQCVRLSRLLEDLLLIARVGSDTTTLEKKPIDLHALLANLADALKPAVARTGLRFDVTIPAEPCWIEADAVRLDQVFSNILTNSIKFTQPGGRIRMTVALTDQHVLVMVGDTGRGIAADVLPHVFEMFATGPDGEGRGLGVGLAVARELVQMHGGNIEISSGGSGCGTDVIVTLPRPHRRH
jgi:signal transduction histidine kinase